MNPNIFSQGGKFLKIKTEKYKEIGNNCNFIYILRSTVKSIVFSFFTSELSFILINYRKIFIRYGNLFKLDPDPYFKSSWIWIRIEKNSWIRTRKK